MKPLYLGTSEFAAAVLSRLAGSGHRPAIVVTPPDSRRGRGRRQAPPPAAAAAQELGLELLQTPDVNDPAVLERIRASGADGGVVCAFGQLIREPLLSELELLNVHPSLLPRWRGAAPIERAILAGDTRTGVSIMRVTAGLDSGPVALAESVEIGERDYGELAGELKDLAGELIVRALDLHRAGELEFAEQDDAAATYAEKIDPAERRLDPQRTANELARSVRALTPHVGAYLELKDGSRLGVLAAHPAADGRGAGDLAFEDGSLLLGCGSGALAIEEVHPPGGRPMPVAAYLRGHPVPKLAPA